MKTCTDSDCCCQTAVHAGEKAVLVVHQQLVEDEHAGAPHGGGEDGVGGRRGGGLAVPGQGESAVFADVLGEEAEDEDETSQGGQRDGVAGHGHHLPPLEPAGPGTHQPGTHEGTDCSTEVNNSTTCVVNKPQLCQPARRVPTPVGNNGVDHA